MIRPVLVVLIGLPGSGKTTLSTWLTQQTDLVVASRDIIRAAMFPQCRYTDEEKAAAYEGMRQAVSIMLGQGLSVCTDGITFSDHRQRQDMMQLAEAAGATGLLVHCDCPISLAQERVLADTLTVFADRTPGLVQRVADRFDPIPPQSLRLDMTRPVESLGATLIRHLRQVSG